MIRCLVFVVLSCHAFFHTSADDSARVQIDVATTDAWLQCASAQLSRVYTLDRNGSLTEFRVTSEGFEIARQASLRMRGIARGLCLTDQAIVISDHTGMFYQIDIQLLSILNSIAFPLFLCSDQEEVKRIDICKNRIPLNQMKSEGGYAVSGLSYARSVDDSMLELHMNDYSILDWNLRRDTVEVRALSNGTVYMDRVGILDEMGNTSFSAGAVRNYSEKDDEKLLNTFLSTQLFLRNEAVNEFTVNARRRDGTLNWTRKCAAAPVLPPDGALISLSPTLKEVCAYDITLGLTEKAITLATNRGEYPAAKSMIALSSNKKRAAILRASTDILIVDFDRSTVVDQFPIDWDVAFHTRNMTVSDDGDVFLCQPQRQRVTCYLVGRVALQK